MSRNQMKGMTQPNPKAVLAEQGSDDALPDWFHGLMSRRETEELLRDQEMGRFLIRLSQRTFGYILSYKGKERCRHFVINQLPDGDLVVSGDCCSHESLPALINHYQTSPIIPFGEKLSKSYIKFSDCNKYDEIQADSLGKQKTKKGPSKSSNEKQEDDLPPSLPPKNRKGCLQQSNQEAAPPLPERITHLNEEDEQIYSTLRKYPGVKERSAEVMKGANKKGFGTLGGKMEANRQQYRETNEQIYSQTKKVGGIYSLAKETQINQKNVVKSKTPEPHYSEINFDKNVPSALGHLQSLSQSASQEAVKLTLDSMSPRIVSNMKGHSEYEVVEMKFATSVQSIDRFNTLTSKGLGGPLLQERMGNAGIPYLYPTETEQEEDTYEPVPLSGLRSMAEHHDLDQISNISISFMSDQVSTRTSTEVSTEHLYERVSYPNPLQYKATETAGRDISKLAGKKQVAVQKNEKQRRFFFAEKKK